MRNIFFILCGFLFLVACGESSGLSSNSSNNNKKANESLGNEAVQYSSEQYSSEELLGKTVDEFEKFKQELEKQASAEKATPQSPQREKREIVNHNGFLRLNWNDLIAQGYDENSIIEKYSPLIEQLEHGSAEALSLYEKMSDEFNNAPANTEFADKNVSIPGFIAPLEQFNGMITEFLLVPYFGACIHMPPPPSNQTLYVKVAPDFEIRNEDAYDPIWVSGKLSISNTTTDIGNASYQINEALISKYQ